MIQYRTSIVAFSMISSLVPLMALIQDNNSASLFSLLIFFRAHQSRHKSSFCFSVPQCLYSGVFRNFFRNSNQYSLGSPLSVNSRKYPTLGYEISIVRIQKRLRGCTSSFVTVPFSSFIRAILALAHSAKMSIRCFVFLIIE